MDDLLAYVLQLIEDDTKTLALFNQCGLPTVDVRPSYLREEAGYPRILVDVSTQGTSEHGDNAPPLYLDGEITVEIVTEQSETCPDSIGMLFALVNRTQALLLGDVDEDGNETVGIKGQDINAKWTVTRTRGRVSKKLSTLDPIYQRHRFDVMVQLLRRARRRP